MSISPVFAAAMSSTALPDVASQNAERAKLVNLGWWTRASCEGQLMARSGRLPDHQVENAWAFESRLMNLAVLEAESGKLPPAEVLFLLSACSDGGEIEPGMQPARADEHRRIDRLCEALRKIVDGCPGQINILRGASARSLADPSHRLWLEGPQQQQAQVQQAQVQQHQPQEQQHQSDEELLRALFGGPPAELAPAAATAAFVPAGAPAPAPFPAPVFAAGPGTAAEPMAFDGQGGDWQPQLDMSFSAQMDGAESSWVLEDDPALAADFLAMMEDYFAAPLVPPQVPVPAPEVGPEVGPEASSLLPLDGDTVMDLFGSAF